MASRSLIEDAVKLIVSGTPASWSRVVIEFEPFRVPMVVDAVAQTGSGWVPVAVPARAAALVAEYARCANWSSRQLVIEADHHGRLTLRSDLPPGCDTNCERAQDSACRAEPGKFVSADEPVAVATASSPRRKRCQVSLWLWGLAMIAAAAMLVVAIAGRDDGATLRAMAASEAMSDGQAHAVAENTVRVWVREHDEGHLANLKALSCTGAFTEEFARIANGTQSIYGRVVATGTLTRAGLIWRLNVFWIDSGSVAVIGIRGGEARVCGFDRAPVS